MSSTSIKSKYKIGEGKRAPFARKWSSDEVIDELSSFIAEFSYLDTPRKVSDQEKYDLVLNQKPVQSFHVYPVNTTDGNVFNKDSTLSFDESTNNLQARPLKKSVEWTENTKDSLTPHRKRSNSPPVQKTWNHTTSSEEVSLIKHQSPNGRRRKHHRLESKSHDRNRHRKDKKPKRPSGTSSSRHRELRPRRSSHSKRGRPRENSVRHKERSRSKSSVRYWPFRYEKIRKYRPISIKKPPPDAERREVKEIILSESPTVVTLYPNNKPPKYKVLHPRYDPQFLADPNLPCKCFACMKKYELLMEVSPDNIREFRLFPKNPEDICQNKERDIHFPRYDGKICKPKKIHKSPRHDGNVRGSCPVTYGQFTEYPEIPEEHWNNTNAEVVPIGDWGPEGYFMPDCTLEQFGMKNNNRVYLRFDCFGQHIDSTILQYFQSILNKTTYF